MEDETEENVEELVLETDEDDVELEVVEELVLDPSSTAAAAATMITTMTTTAATNLEIPCNRDDN